MTYAQYAGLIEGHNRAHDPKRRRRARTQEANHGDIAALKTIAVASG